LAPIQVKIINVLVRNQKLIFLFGENFLLLVFFVGRIIRIKMAMARAVTPPSFDGIDRRMAYANRKYHSGWMWMGVTSGFAGFRFSTSPSKSGLFEIIAVITIAVQHIGVKSFTVKSGWNFIFSRSGDSPDGFDEPPS